MRPAIAIIGMIVLTLTPAAYQYALRNQEAC